MPGPDQPILHCPSVHVLLFSAVRLGLAAMLGALVGYQRERVHSTAGLRMHMLVCVGAAFFVLAAVESGATAAANAGDR